MRRCVGQLRSALPRCTLLKIHGSMACLQRPAPSLTPAPSRLLHSASLHIQAARRLPHHRLASHPGPCAWRPPVAVDCCRTRSQVRRDQRLQRWGWGWGWGRGGAGCPFVWQKGRTDRWYRRPALGHGVLTLGPRPPPIFTLFKPEHLFPSVPSLQCTCSAVLGPGEQQLRGGPVCPPRRHPACIARAPLMMYHRQPPCSPMP